MRPLITLTTDFGWRDPYVAAMKGVLHARCPGARIEDLSHDIPPQDLVAAALFVAGAAPFFPASTIHVVVVDPEVGAARHLLAVRAGQQYIVCPDNGVLSLFLESYPLESARIIENTSATLQPVSPTFHGRDIFAPAAAFLAAGGDFAALGSELPGLHRLALPEARIDGEKCRGEIIHVDHFGNCITNIHQRHLEHAEGALVICGDARLPLRKTYADVAPGQLVALFGSAGLLEIARRNGSAAKAFNLHQGAPIQVLHHA